MILLTNEKLPAEITDALNGTRRFRCRIGWKITANGYKSHGAWHDLSQEDLLRAEMEDANRRNAGKMEHWIEYE